MKKTIIFALSLMAALYTNAQVDLKINPIGAIFGSPDLSAEFQLKENVGLEAGLGFNVGGLTIDEFQYRRSGISGFLAGKYYLNPQQGTDRLAIGVYTRYRNIDNKVKDSEDNSSNFSRTLFATGLLISQKWLSQSGVVFEIDFGAGRAIVNDITFDDEANSEVSLDEIPGLNIDLILRFAVGYRF
jgi:hypothetical protein